MVFEYMTIDERNQSPLPALPDLLIIGAGPAGLAAGIAARRAGLSHLIVDRGGVAHAIQAFKRDMLFFSTPELLEIEGVPFIVQGSRPTSADCVKYYRAVAAHFGLQFLLGTEIKGIRRSETGFTLTTGSRSDLHARSVVIATGYYDTPKRLGVPGEDLPIVQVHFTDALPYHRRKVVIVGGKNSAVEAALELWRAGADVTVVHRGAALSDGVKYWLLPDFRNRVEEKSIRLLLDTTVVRFEPSGVVVRTRPSGAGVPGGDAGNGGEGNGQEQSIACDRVFTLIGYEADARFLTSCGVAVDPATGGPVFDPATMETSVPGIYVAGGLVGGRFNNKVFIENGREHGGMIVAHLAKRDAPETGI
jgi:thioredoxin reductase (NADPH)